MIQGLENVKTFSRHALWFFWYVIYAYMFDLVATSVVFMSQSIIILQLFASQWNTYLLVGERTNRDLLSPMQ